MKNELILIDIFYLEKQFYIKVYINNSMYSLKQYIKDSKPYNKKKYYFLFNHGGIKDDIKY